MALLSGDKWMINALQEGNGDFFDTHLMPVAFPHLVELYGSMEAYKASDPVQHKEDRTKVKAVQYGLAFGRQAFAIGQSLGMSTKAAQTIIDNYLGTAEEFAQWREDVMEAAIDPAKRELLINPFGRKFQSEVITTKNWRNIQREALSFLPQSTSSDICLSTGIRIHKDLADAGYKVFNIVHDAIMIEGPEDEIETAAQYVAHQMRETGRKVFGDTVPFLTDYDIGDSWENL